MMKYAKLEPFTALSITYLCRSSVLRLVTPPSEHCAPREDAEF